MGPVWESSLWLHYILTSSFLTGKFNMSFLSRDHFLLNLLPSGVLLNPTFTVEVCVYLLWAPHLLFFAWLVILELDPTNTSPLPAGHGANLCSLGCWRDVAGEDTFWLAVPFRPAPVARLSCTGHLGTFTSVRKMCVFLMIHAIPQSPDPLYPLP